MDFDLYNYIHMFILFCTKVDFPLSSQSTGMMETVFTMN